VAPHPGDPPLIGALQRCSRLRQPRAAVFFPRGPRLPEQSPARCPRGAGLKSVRHCPPCTDGLLLFSTSACSSEEPHKLADKAVVTSRCSFPE